MVSKGSKPAKSKDLGAKRKITVKEQKIRKKRKHRRKSRLPSFSYNLLPKHKRLATAVVTKLDNENDQYTLARGVDAINRLDQGKPVEAAIDIAIPHDEATWRNAIKGGTEYAKWKQDRITSILQRAKNRKKKAEAKQEQELHRKRYRVHPNDPVYKYSQGYRKSRHRISKKRFMDCVDVPLFKDVLNNSKDLLESPLWAGKLHLNSLSIEKAKQLKDHLHQFDVLVESLKQGIFDIPGCDDYPLGYVRRKKVIPRNSTTEKPIKKHKIRSRSNSKTKGLKRGISFPPFEESTEKLQTNNEDETFGVLKDALNYMTSWIHWNPINATNPGITQIKAPPNKDDAPSSVSTVQDSSEDYEKTDVGTNVPQPFKWARKTTLKSFLPPLKSFSLSLPNQTNDGRDPEKVGNTPFSNLLTMDVPEEFGRKKKFIRTLIDRKMRKLPTKNKTTTAAVEAAKEEDEARRRYERAEKSDPLQRLHPDEKESDIQSASSTTTTSGYASWRRPRDLRNAGNKQDILAHKVDTSFGWRVVLLLIVMWELGCFVKKKLDDIYYWIFTSHLYRENIWLFEPTLFPEMDKYWVIHLQEWIHAIISGISLSIIHRENECVSILFAFSLLFEGVVEIGVSTHYYVYLPEPITWVCVILTSLHVVWKVFIICLFIGYHYYCSGYIRKAREFKHREIKLHNHEIKAKGTKGLQKQRMAWSWMVRHARNTNLRNLKQKYPDVKDGNFPEDELTKHIKFSEAKELRLYTQNHNLNIGYPYNKLRDMKRYVFKKLEKSDYTDHDAVEETEIARKKWTKMARGSSRAFTLDRLQTWRNERIENERSATLRRMSRISMSGVGALDVSIPNRRSSVRRSALIGRELQRRNSKAVL